MSGSTFDVVVVGNVGIDTNVYLAGSDIDFSVEANFTKNLDYVGQAGGYAGRGFARLGKKTAFIGHVGDDYHGHLIREEFARDGIDTTALFVDPQGTSRSINFMYRDGRRKNFYDGKGHMDFEPDLGICRQILSQAKLAHFNIPNWARHLLPVAQELDLTISCDIQDIVSPDDGYRRDFIKYADILFFSATNHPDPTPLIENFLGSKPERIVIVGMGAKGCALGIKDGIQFFSPVEMDAPVIDTNGAGDGLAVGFLSSYVLDKYSLQASVMRGQIVARYTCTQKATSSNLITSEQLAHYFSRMEAKMNYDQLLDRFINWAQTQEDIVAAIVVGSQARKDTPADEWSDLDLIIITTNVERYLTQTDWIAELGPYWLNFIEKQGVGEGFEHRVLFEGGMDVDFIPTPFAEIQQIIAHGWPPDWAGVLRRGYKTILDKQDLAQQLPPLEATPPTATKSPTAQEFGNLCNDFLYHTVWAAKKLRRGELWIAKGCMDMYMKHLLLQMIEWHARTTHGWDYDVWHRGRFIERWADPRIINDLKQAFAHYDETEVKQALFATLALFRWVAEETAEKLECTYPIDGDRQVTRWLTSCLRESPIDQGR